MTMDDLSERAAAKDYLPDPNEVVGRDEEIPLVDVFEDEFIGRHTDFETFDAMVAASPSDAESAADLEYVRMGTWDEFVAETTSFDDEEEFVFAARDHWIATQLGL